MTFLTGKASVRMSFYSEFLRAFAEQPLKALICLYWHLTRRRLRARRQVRRMISHLPYAFDVWARAVEQLPQVLQQAPAIMAKWTRSPFFSLLVNAEEGEAEEVERLLRAAEEQCYEHWELLLVTSDKDLPPHHAAHPKVRVVAAAASGHAALLNAGIAAARGDFLVPVPRGAVLPLTALFRYAEAVQVHPDAGVFYGDQDRLSQRGDRECPWFKSQWNSEMFFAQDYISDACALATDCARAAGPVEAEADDAAVYALVERISRLGARQVVHIPHVLAHVRDHVRDNQVARVGVLSASLAAEGASVRAGLFGSVHVIRQLPDPLPLVSIIVPTRDKAQLLRACLDSVLGQTSYSSYEILIVDNGSVEPTALAYLNHLKVDSRVRVLGYDAPYNFSAINNFAARQARGSYLCLLNNDTEVVSPDWLDAMMRQAVRDDVGAVGAKLLYPDGTIQHAGVVIGIGQAAGHAHRFQKADEEGYFNRAHVQHFASAVTAACLVVQKRKFDAVGGLDEQNFKVAFNDVDLCLKLERAGWRNLYEPEAVLVHHESKSRGSDMSQRNIARYRSELAVLQERWHTATYVDPLHNPNLDRSSETYILRLAAEDIP